MSFSSSPTKTILPLHSESHVTILNSSLACHHTWSFFRVHSLNFVHEVVGVPLRDFLWEGLFVVWEILCRSDKTYEFNLNKILLTLTQSVNLGQRCPALPRLHKMCKHSNSAHALSVKTEITWKKKKEKLVNSGVLGREKSGLRRCWQESKGIYVI